MSVHGIWVYEMLPALLSILLLQGHPGSTSWMEGVGWSQGGDSTACDLCADHTGLLNLLNPLFAPKEITLTQGETTGIQWGGVSSIPSQSAWSGMGSVVTASCWD